jgi:hypothetical protein
MAAARRFAGILRGAVRVGLGGGVLTLSARLKDARRADRLAAAWSTAP